MQTLQKFNGTYPNLFDHGNDDKGDDDGRSEEHNDDFHSQYGWFYNTKQVADYEGVKLDEVWDFGIVHVLNDLSYLKAKDQHEGVITKRVMKT